jgi:hypothetical protein
VRIARSTNHKIFSDKFLASTQFNPKKFFLLFPEPEDKGLAKRADGYKRKARPAFAEEAAEPNHSSLL